eukprot:scaffold9241_cov66-Phaeocystis_antarctica.AAC.5
MVATASNWLLWPHCRRSRRLRQWQQWIVADGCQVVLAPGKANVSCPLRQLLPVPVHFVLAAPSRLLLARGMRHCSATDDGYRKGHGLPYHGHGEPEFLLAPPPCPGAQPPPDHADAEVGRAVSGCPCPTLHGADWRQRPFARFEWGRYCASVTPAWLAWPACEPMPNPIALTLTLTLTLTL